eukprot:scaffold288989_cov30-Prasinocladus_malaysianus.AAC.1
MLPLPARFISAETSLSLSERIRGQKWSPRRLASIKSSPPFKYFLPSRFGDCLPRVVLLELQLLGMSYQPTLMLCLSSESSCGPEPNSASSNVSAWTLVGMLVRIRVIVLSGAHHGLRGAYSYSYAQFILAWIVSTRLASTRTVVSARKHRQHSLLVLVLV